MTTRSIALLLTLAASACDGGRDVPPGQPGGNTTRPDGGGSITGRDAGVRMGTHRARCEQACARPTTGPCATADEATCANDCVARTEGLSAACATCLGEESGWAGRACTCIGTGCNACSFGPGDNACGGAAPTDTCAASDESCRGYEHSAIVSGRCGDACVGAGTTPMIGSLDARCEQACRRPATGPCATGDEAACVASCKTRFQALPAACVLCVLDESGWAGRACGCYGAGCNACGFGPQPSACQNAGPEDTCAASDESCTGFELGETSSSGCRDLCR